MPLPTSSPAQQALEWQAAKATFDTRCIVCHGCYDAPCQLKLTSWDGIARGASHDKVYEASRLTEAAPTRLGVDAHTLEDWRDKHFRPVLPENEQMDPRLSLLTRMLELKQTHPLTLDGEPLSKAFELGLDRDEVCADADGFGAFAKDHPSWGMPYALPGLTDAEHASLVGWVAAGTPHDPPAELAPNVQDAVSRWEEFLNGTSLKEQLVARYIYEHLFYGTLFFEGLDDVSTFRLVRSRTPTGQPIDEVATRRPFDDPKQPVVYYRFVQRDETRLSKMQMPYALSDARLARYRELFGGPEYEVTSLPGYAGSTAANPFSAFVELPVGARYRFMLEEAMFTMAGFIKGPVCRGQVALNVIEDRFWIAFIHPDSPIIEHQAKLLADSVEDLALPAEMGSNNPLVLWRRYASQEENFQKAKSRYLSDLAQSPADVALTQLWDGDGKNDNAVLTVLRHFDSATVVKGLVGGHPKTAWVVDYSLLERIHYLLVAGYDVFGNVGHQLHSRLYMDFLRMEAEYNFLTFLPKARRRPLVEAWYRDTSDEVKDHVYGEYAFFTQESGIPYQTDTPEHELFDMIRAYVAPVLPRDYEGEREEDVALRDALEAAAHAPGAAANRLSETSFVEVLDEAGTGHYFTLLRDSAHTNVAHVFNEDDRRVPREDSLTALRGFVGAYPNTLYSVNRDELGDFVSAVSEVDGDASYDTLRRRFGVRRTDPRFWAISDRMHAAYREQEPLHYGVFDYNRLDRD
jgi:hypothetical protein